jgi:hypothetical protein
LTHCIFCEIVAQEGPAPGALLELLKACPDVPVR